MKRRKLLSIASLATAGMLTPIGWNSWVATGKTKSAKAKRLVVVFLRGGIDGLNVVIPHQEADYYQARPTIAIPYPQEENGALDLDGFFGLHPQLKDLMPLWQDRNLAFIHGSGSPIVERSHFQAQDYLENGTPGIKSTRDGWMNRLLGELCLDHQALAINVGNTTPYILKGDMPSANLKPGINSTAAIATDNPLIDQAFSYLYSGTDDLSKAYQDGQASRQLIIKELGEQYPAREGRGAAALREEMIAAARGARNVNAFVDDAGEVAKLLLSDPKNQLVFMDVSGWDTHINQANILNRLLPSLGQGLATLVEGIKPIFADTVIVVMSEFGRTVKENGNKGTDHGSANAMWVLGGAIAGGKVYGNWQGLNRASLYQNRDLAVTTDFRDVLDHILQAHLSMDANSLKRVFPNYHPTNRIDFLT
ncbi:twin-arginine translocation pathway signal [Chondrocystis sp. NIES-4102]|nr:twin-arginine translocation pathway signal [Chondrocystis sp. NIES-4102]